jgi:hypothetical protein
MKRLFGWLIGLLLAGQGLAQTYILAQMDAGDPTPFAPLRQAGPHWVVTSFLDLRGAEDPR